MRVCVTPQVQEVLHPAARTPTAHERVITLSSFFFLAPRALFRGAAGPEPVQGGRPAVGPSTPAVRGVAGRQD